MKILNLYAGIGGNRKLWGNDHKITAIEFDEEIAAIYKDLYPNDEVIVTDAHDFLLKNYMNYDFIWGSPPCPSHSVTNHFLNAQGIIRYPDMALYQEILLLQHFFKGKYCIENVKSYYAPLVLPQESGRHFFWANFRIPKLKYEKQIGRMNGTKISLDGETTHTLRTNNHDLLEFDLSKYNLGSSRKEKLLNNCVHPEIGKEILNRANGIINQSQLKQIGLFKDLTF